MVVVKNKKKRSPQFPQANALFVAYGLIHAYLLVYLLTHIYAKEEAICEAILVLLEAGLVFDNIVLAFGGFVRHAPFFPRVSRVRFILHGTVIPACAVVLFHLLHRWRPQPEWSFGGVYVGVVALMVAALYQTLTEGLKYSEKFGVARYTAQEFKLSKIVPAIVLTLLQMALGLVQWREQGQWTLLVGATVMLVVASIPRKWGFYLSNGGEVVLCTSMIMTTFSCSLWQLITMA